MLFTEWNWDDAKQVWQEETRKEDREEILDFIRKGYNLNDIEKILLSRS